MGPIWGRQDPGGPHLAPWTLLSGVPYFEDHSHSHSKWKWHLVWLLWQGIYLPNTKRRVAWDFQCHFVILYLEETYIFYRKNQLSFAMELSNIRLPHASKGTWMIWIKSTISNEDKAQTVNTFLGIYCILCWYYKDPSNKSNSPVAHFTNMVHLRLRNL